MDPPNEPTPDDPRLGRLPQFDPRSRRFAVREAIPATAIQKPRSYTWAPGPVLNQGWEGSCVGHAWAHDAGARPVVIAGADHTFARDRIYWEAQKIDWWDGGSYPGASPVYEGTSVLAGAKVCQGLGLFAEYRWAFGLTDLILAVGYKGPAVLGINWYEGMNDPNDKGFVVPEGRLAGGHAILCYQVNLPGQFFGLQNSWGEFWGLNGRCKISFDHMHKLLAEAGEACFAINRKVVTI